MRKLYIHAISVLVLTTITASLGLLAYGIAEWRFDFTWREIRIGFVFPLMFWIVMAALNESNNQKAGTP